MYLCMFVVAFCACMVHAQTLHRYVVEVETVPDKREYKAEKLYRHRKNVTLDGWDGVNPADAEQTEYDLNYEDPDLYDFIAD